MLQKVCIEVVVKLQGVGNNVQEHFNMGVTYHAAIILLCLHDTKGFKQR